MGDDRVAVLALALVAGCADGVSLGDWEGAREDGSRLPTRTRHYASDGTYQTSFDGDGTWTLYPGDDSDDVVHCRFETCTPDVATFARVDAARTRLVMRGTRLPILVRVGGADGPFAGSMWAGSIGGCCANGSPFATSSWLTLEADGRCRVRSESGTPVPFGPSFDCTWDETPLGLSLTTDHLEHIGLVRAGDALGEDGYVRVR